VQMAPKSFFRGWLRMQFFAGLGGASVVKERRRANEESVGKDCCVGKRGLQRIL